MWSCYVDPPVSVVLSLKYRYVGEELKAVFLLDKEIPFVLNLCGSV